MFDAETIQEAKRWLSANVGSETEQAILIADVVGKLREGLASIRPVEHVDRIN